MFKFINKFVGDSNEKALKEIYPIVDEINDLEPEFEKLSDDALKGVTEDLRSRYNAGEDLDDLLPEAFAAVREASRRTIGMRHFDVQMIGGIVLHQGKISEMRTGEGKTLVATLPTYLNAITGEGAHVITVNDYLAKRDAGWMGAVHHFLGLTIGCLQNDSSWVFNPDAPLAVQAEDQGEEGEADTAPPVRLPEDNFQPGTKQEAYACDITYGTNNEFGFDYLRDNMVDEADRRVQRGRVFAIVDEVDNILIDEARTPLIISGPAKEQGQEYRKFAVLAKRLTADVHFEIEDKRKTIVLTEEGIEAVERELKVENLYGVENDVLSHFTENAIRAEHVYYRDREYVVQGQDVVLVDEFTGRLMTGRRFSDGMHQALEAKEGVKVQRESNTYATITLQNYFRMYEKLAGMTGTATTEAEELDKIYKLEVVEIPTNRDTQRIDRGDYIYMTEEAKWNAIAERIAELHNDGRPVLVGTTTIDKSELLGDLLKKKHIPHNVLNAKQHEREANVVAEAGKAGAVTVATNMAGRGTDIILGGNPDVTVATEAGWQSDHDVIVQKGGLFVLGTERHESRRIDNQLRGRCGRQGDPGETQFFLSTEDDIVRRFGGDRIRGAMKMFHWEEDVPIENKMVSKSVETAQTKVEAQNFEIRKYLVDYDDVVNTQRDVIYQLRDRVIDGEDLRPTISEYLAEEVRIIVDDRINGGTENYDVEGLYREMMLVFPTLDGFPDPDDILEMRPDEAQDVFADLIDTIYEKRTGEFGAELLHKLERTIMLRTIDEHWVEHLTSMDNMRQGIGLEAAGQRDPLVAYKRQAFQMFTSLDTTIKSSVARTIFRVALTQQPAPSQTPEMNALKVDADVSTQRANTLANQKSIMATVNSGHGGQTGGNSLAQVPTHSSDGKKYTRAQRRKIERLQRKQAKQNTE
ncbi:MAG TPA: preprotein translocase subunit SecA [Dehalococcoidia bacterium]|jgi:preprotein translocase subunit SecA|nr:preprotein translocase subunit SecA [Dehalococcoidia bacterium]HIK89437.1 preprotein translocase subunit SecA [Dehalococcoidia bacterium]